MQRDLEPELFVPASNFQALFFRNLEKSKRFRVNGRFGVVFAGKNGQEQSQEIRDYGRPNPAQHNWGDTLIAAVISLARAAAPGSLR